MKLQLKIRSSLVRNILILLSSMFIGALFNLPFGWGAVLDFVTSMVICIVITMVLADAWYKICKEKWKLCWQYWIGIILVLLSDWAFLWASKTTTFPRMFMLLAITVFISLGAGSWFYFVYKPIVETKEDESLDEYKKALIDQGITEATAESIVSKAKEG